MLRGRGQEDRFPGRERSRWWCAAASCWPSDGTGEATAERLPRSAPDAQGGLKGKGPVSYKEKAHVLLLVAQPAGKAGATCLALTSHLDPLSTFVGLTGLP